MTVCTSRNLGDWQSRQIGAAAKLPMFPRYSVWIGAPDTSEITSNWFDLLTLLGVPSSDLQTTTRSFRAAPSAVNCPGYFRTQTARSGFPGSRTDSSSSTSVTSRPFGLNMPLAKFFTSLPSLSFSMTARIFPLLRFQQTRPFPPLNRAITLPLEIVGAAITP